jgi:hypothetical protein
MGVAGLRRGWACGKGEAETAQVARAQTRGPLLRISPHVVGLFVNKGGERPSDSYAPSTTELHAI